MRCILSKLFIQVLLCTTAVTTMPSAPITTGYGEVENLELTLPANTSSTAPVFETKELPSTTIETFDHDASSQHGSTEADLANMHRMGKDQELVRHFRFLSIAAFTALATAAWEIGLFLLTPGLVDGGRSGLIYNTLWNFVGFAPVYLSMAEMASIAPIAGAQ